MRTVKTVALVLGALIAVVVLALIAVWLLVNPNDFKPQIAAAVKRSTGRDLVLKGNIALSVFPGSRSNWAPHPWGTPLAFPRSPSLRSRTPQSGSNSCRSSRNGSRSAGSSWMDWT